MTSKLDIVIADPDSTYLQLLATYIRQTKWSERLNVKWFTKQETLMSEWQVSPGMAHLYLVHSNWFPERWEQGWIMLDVSKVSQPMNSKEPRLFKYQPIEQLLAAAVEGAERHRLTPLAGNNQELVDMTVFAVISATGGSGKTTTALHLSRLFAAEGEHCLMLHLDSIGSLHKPDTEYSRLFGRYLYYSREGSTKAVEQLRKLIRRHPIFPIDLIGGSGAFREMEELTSLDIQRLLEHVKALSEYSKAVVDLDAGISPAVRGAMTASDRLVCIVSEDCSSVHKTAEFLSGCPQWLDTDFEPVRAKLWLVMNSLKSDSAIEDPRSVGITLPIAAKLPYIPQWKQAPAWSHEQSNPLFERSMQQLAEAIHSGGRGLRHAAIH
ncbi:MAG: hypothetical protein K0R67_77 [Paenibacillus sp.]|nr:hypothetical protein [Paenibacillus sp.]